jgi:deazaflavin-dependent oxidoreductase (nitroreductase family)
MSSVNPLFKLFVALQVWLYETSKGRFGSTLGGQRLILLTTKGRKSGRERTVPVMKYLDGDDMYVIASLAGAPKHPAWFHNLKADPAVRVRYGAETFSARAKIVEDPAERERLWNAIVAAMPRFGEYQKKTTRVIPVVKLERV